MNLIASDSSINNANGHTVPKSTSGQSNQIYMTYQLWKVDTSHIGHSYSLKLRGPTIGTVLLFK